MKNPKAYYLVLEDDVNYFQAEIFNRNNWEQRVLLTQDLFTTLAEIKRGEKEKLWVCKWKMDSISNSSNIYPKTIPVLYIPFLVLK